MIHFDIDRVDETLIPSITKKIDGKTKPVGSLGLLESIAARVALIQNTLDISLKKPTIVIFASDHGITAEGVSQFPQEVTYQMVFNFLSGGAAINVFANQHHIDLKIVDSGVNYDFTQSGKDISKLVHAKIQMGTKNFLHEKAMSEEDCVKAIEKGAELTESIYNTGTNVIGFGEMGIGNTSSAAVLMSLFCGIPLDRCVGRGTGLDDEGLERKKETLTKAIKRHKNVGDSPISILSTFGGFEIAMMTGAMLKAAELRMIILVDGFITTSALLSAHKINENVLDYVLFSHQSQESGHQVILNYFEAKAVLDLNMRLGEGTGAAVAYPIIQSAVHFFNEMASFESAQVTQD